MVGTSDEPQNEAVRADELAYEIRRISEMMSSVANGRPIDRSARGPLATRLATSFALRGIDVDLALSVLAAEIDYEFGTRVRAIASQELGFLAALVPRLEQRLALQDSVGPESPVIRSRLLRRGDGGTLTATRRFRTTVFGLPVLAMLPDFATRIDATPGEVPWVTAPAGLISAMQQSATSTLCVVTGSVGVGKSSWAKHAAYSVANGVLRIDAARATRSRSDVAEEIRELLEDAAMTGCPAIVDNVGDLLQRETKFSLLIEEVLDTTNACVFLVLGDHPAHDRISMRALAHVHVEAPSASVRRELWENARTTPQIRDMLADDLVLSPRQIANAVALIETGADPARAAFDQLPKTHNLTLPDRATTKLDALVLPEETRQEIVELVGAIRARSYVLPRLGTSRGRAITALFNGDSGTGKTFACEVVAAEVGLPLMRVNVASLVDKYLGETEKNLTRVFAQAQGQGGILFFDEADALFGARTDVSRAQDRYANLETNLLLQLMESFSGIVLLTTNLKQNIDPAFLRRLMFKVYFETPEPPERERLWRTAMPIEEFAPNIDYPRLARTFELTGGSIRAAAIRAAYRAASAGTRIVMMDLVECAQLETQGMGRVATW